MNCRLCNEEISYDEDREPLITLPGGLTYGDMWGDAFENEHCQDCQDDLAEAELSGW